MTLRRVLGFKCQMKAVTDAYVKWGATQSEYGLEAPLNAAPPPMVDDQADGVYSIKVVDMFSAS